MGGWQRHIQSIIRQAGKKLEQSCSRPLSLPSARINASSTLGQFRYLHRTSNTSPTNILRPFHQYLQQSGISSSRKLLSEASSDQTPVANPLSSPVLQIGDGTTETQAVVPKRASVQAVLKDIKQSPKKVNLVAALVRGMRVEDALLQLQLTVKRASKTVYQVIHSARANATHNHGLDKDRLLVAEAFVGKGLFKKRVSYHAKGRSGVKVRAECRLTVVVREMTPEEEAEIARLRVHNFRKLSKRERRLVPHKLIETTPVWGRKSKPSNSEKSSMA
ncbi:hypothetical protein C5167_030237 [Papaver somniferum]|uniref:uncharacterized protein LOC113329463 n=1 Tax=Papaver somniferum TaxID=3469 RepID=UPI000E6F8470|nr:uncharacterized protein LOC113329463 [Papaver somniferum]XP_026432120.1 uncharacterized protein LOC113329463 [Papaver somniferum]RZC86885.1 hypothetical protein C5167_030237 [Papaver somniferum]